MEIGYKDDAGDEFGVKTYRGVLTKNGCVENLQTKTATLHVLGFTEIPNKYSGEKLSDNQVTGETIGAGDGITDAFNTTNNGVGIVRAVYVDGVLQLPGVAYTVSNLNDKDNPATITFNAGYIPALGTTITCDYVYWYQDKTIEYVVEKAIEGAGITDHSIQPVVFPDDVENTNVQDTKAEFDAGSKEGTYTQGTEDRIYAERVANMVISSGSQFDMVQNRYYAQGFKVNNDDTNLEEIGWFFATQIDYPYGPINRNESFTVQIRQDNAGQPGAVLETQNFTKSFYYHHVATQWEVFKWFDGFTQALTSGTQYWVVVRKTNANAAHTEFRLKYSNNSAYGDGAYYYSDDGVAWNSGTATWDLAFAVKTKMVWVSDTIDGTASLTAWNKIVESVPVGDNYTIFTRTQAADAGWPASFDPADWEEVGAGGIINSDADRYLRMAIRYDRVDPEYNGAYPWLLDNEQDFETDDYAVSFTIYYNTSAINIELVNLTGLSCSDIIRDCQSFCDYEFGFTMGRQFFWREKDLSTTPDIVLNGITDIIEFKIDSERIFTIIRATFGDYTYYRDPDTEGESSPNGLDTYGDEILEISGGSILSDEEASLAKNASKIYYDRYVADSETKKFVRFTCKLYPQLDLGDSVYLSNGGLTLTIIFWDDLEWDDLYWGYGEEPYGLVFKVISILFDPMNLETGGMEIIGVEV